MEVNGKYLKKVDDSDIVNGIFEIPKGVTWICKGAFKRCITLERVTNSESVTHIGKGAFSCCENLRYFTIPERVIRIDLGTFYKCRNLIKVTIPKSTISIDSYAFYKCSSLTNITVAKGNPQYHSARNCLIETDSKTLIFGCQNSVIPTDGSVTSIGEYAFYGCSSLTSITIPDSVTSIGNGAFGGCSELTRINIPVSVTRIGHTAFEGCSSLTNIIIPESVVYIGDAAFYGCDRLQKIGAWKATEDDLACRCFQYTLDTWYEEPKAHLCHCGFHYCENAFDIFNYYSGYIGQDLRIFKVDAKEISPEREIDSKRCCQKIKLVEEIKSFAELLNN